MDLHVDPLNSGLKKRKQEEEEVEIDNGNSMSVGESSGSGVLCKSSTSASMNSNNPNDSNSNISCQDDEDMIDDEGLDDAPDYGFDFYYNDDDDDAYENDYLSLMDQFDNVDLPPGVEATVPWLKDIAPSESKQGVAPASAESSSKGKTEETEDEVMQKFRRFKQFDTVDAYPDHFYDKEGAKEAQSPKNWAKKILEEWKILEEILPETIFVRACEGKMELLRAAIIGPQGTPYHDSIFFFDCYFPSTYPAIPPKVHYHAGGLRLNPNLYACGKVCLSLLGTWHGKNSENWIPEKSTMLQVLVSIQALILNEKPFFNEPGYSSTYAGQEGQRRSKDYNDNTFILSLKTMMYTMRKPPKHFEDLVAGHFRERAYDILIACRSYVEGAPVGAVVHDLAQTTYNSTPYNDNQKEFQSAVSRMMNTLIAFFTKNGSTDCEEFRSLDLCNISDVATINLELYKIESASTLAITATDV
ncbi:hypothetical protein Lal_00023863 [Lupinus albus]|uniref:Putative aminoacyltransferase, E1 ubiquitin-activating enzyme n=1 Tax=Lupinus albus TaxID=3870 RepID=A0A6A4PHN9_LUPAL|nr:putative aminoacyltransferase, E1 ubiquitin-activating enzyme [Lupinus albus]KAF1887855.1 hypothetical protein Lal_00023863 [Lupinus albus]